MANPDVLASGVVDRLKTIGGLEVYNGWPDVVHAPCAIVDYVGDEPEQTMGRGDLTRFDFNVEVLIPLSAGWSNARSRLGPLLATSSTGGIYGAIAGDRTLGGIAGGTFVKGRSNPERAVIDDGLHVLQATMRLEIWSS